MSVKDIFFRALRAEMYEYRRYAFRCSDSVMKVITKVITCTREVNICVYKMQRRKFFDRKKRNGIKNFRIIVLYTVLYLALYVFNPGWKVKDILID